VLVGHENGIDVVSLETGESKRVIEPGATPRYVSGYLLHWYEQSLYAAPFDLDALAVTGPAVPVVEPVRRMTPGPALYDVSEDGSLVYVRGGASSISARSLVWVERDGSIQPVSDTRRPFRSPRLSPDGNRIALQILEAPGVADVWIYDIPRDGLRRLTLGGVSGSPVWSPDGRKVAYTTEKNEAWILVQTASDGSGTPEELVSGGGRHVVADSWSRDGRSLLYTLPAESTGWDEWVLSAEDGSSRVFAASPAYDSEGAFSPDGKWVAYQSAESGTGELYVQPFGGGAPMQISDRGGREPVWTGAGEIVYRNGRRIMTVTVQTEPDFHAGTPKILFEGPFELETGGYRNFDVTRDGERFVMILSEDEPLDRLVFVVNFDEELKRLVPSR
jgi:hypothetical protein